jgi:hypothetical protein
MRRTGWWLLAALGPADLTLAEVPSPEAEQIGLDVDERACASGQPADGRVEIFKQATPDEQLMLVVGVRPLVGDQDCPDNPPPPVTIQLDEPLGDRDVVDASTLPPQPLEPSPTIANHRQQLTSAIEQPVRWGARFRAPRGRDSRSMAIRTDSNAEMPRGRSPRRPTPATLVAYGRFSCPLSGCVVAWHTVARGHRMSVAGVW